MMHADNIVWMLMLSVLCNGASVVLSYMSKWLSVAAAYAALVLAAAGGVAFLDTSTLIFWGAASAIAIAITALLPKNIRDTRVGLPYFCTGALVGMAIGMLTNTSAGIITGSAAGVVLGALAFSRADRTNPLDFPSRRFFNYLCAKGLPLTVVASMAGICILSIANAFKTASL